MIVRAKIFLGMRLLDNTLFMDRGSCEHSKIKEGKIIFCYFCLAIASYTTSDLKAKYRLVEVVSIFGGCIKHPC